MNIKPRAIPFRVGGPIQDPADFIGRREILQVISTAMLNLQSISVHGERRTGKTSLLLYLAHSATASDIGLSESHIPVYFNFQEFAEASIANVWGAIADAVAEQIRKRCPKGQNESEQFLTTISEFLNVTNATQLFSTGFGRAFSRLDTLGFKFHLLFDEFDQTVRNPNLGDPFYDALRSLPTRTENISYVIATRTGLAALQPVYDKISSPLFNIFTSVILSPFQEDEVHDLIFDYFARAELDHSLAEKLCDQSLFLYMTTGYHPFFLQTLCYHLCAELDKLDWPLGQAQQEALRAFEKDSEPHFDYYWQVSSENEQRLLNKLATGQPVDGEQSEIVALLEGLRDRCLVVQTKNDFTGELKLFSPAFNKWIKNLSKPFKHKSDPWRILVVDDHPGWQRILKTIFKELNCTVVLASDYAEAKEYLTLPNFDLATIDLELDKSVEFAEGLGLISEIREIFGPKFPIIIVTGKGNLDRQRRAFKDYNVIDFIEKAKFKDQEFKRIVIETINRSQ